MPLRVADAIVGAWLFASALLWPHSGPQVLNAWLCGDMVLLFALLGHRRGPQVIGLWLTTASVLLPSWHPATAYNHALVGLILIALPFLSEPKPTASVYRA
jgi:hypothetical protein